MQIGIPLDAIFDNSKVTVPLRNVGFAGIILA